MTKPAPATLKIRMHPRTRGALEQAARQRGVSLNSEIVQRLESSFDQREPYDFTKVATELLQAMQLASTLKGEAERALEIHSHLTAAFQELLMLPPGKKLDVRFDGDRIVSDLIVDDDQ